MKSKKIVAMIVAFAAFMALATSGFAAVTTTTTYNNIADKVEVKVNVTEATPDSEVTYLVKNKAEQIVYIDQKTATGGSVSFDYKIAKDKIADLYTTVQFGTDGDAIVGDDKDIQLEDVKGTTDANVVSVEYYKDAACSEEKKIGTAVTVGDGDVVYAKFTIADDYAIDPDTVSGLEGTGTANIYKVTSANYTVKTKTTYVAPSVGELDEEIADAEINAALEEKTYKEEINGKEVEVKSVVKVFKAIGTDATKAGVRDQNDVDYPAYTYDANAEGNRGSTTIVPGAIYAVKVIVESGEELTLTPYVEE